MQYQLAVMYTKSGKLYKAEELILACLEARMTVLGANHSDTVRANILWGYLNINRGRYTEAENILKKCQIKIQS